MATEPKPYPKQVSITPEDSLPLSLGGGAGRGAGFADVKRLCGTKNWQVFDWVLQFHAELTAHTCNG